MTVAKEGTWRGCELSAQNELACRIALGHGDHELSQLASAEPSDGDGLQRQGVGLQEAALLEHRLIVPDIPAKQSRQPSVCWLRGSMNTNITAQAAGGVVADLC